MQYPDPVQLREVLSQYYSTSELRTMCFDMGIDYEELGGRGKSENIIEIVAYAQRVDHLPKIGAYVQRTRPHVQLTMSNTPPKPMAANLGKSPETKQEINNYYAPVYQGDGGTMETKIDKSKTTDNSISFGGSFTGDFVQGDKVTGDKVAGDKITVGNITGSNVAIGRGATATSSSGEIPQDKEEFTTQLNELKALLADALAKGEFNDTDDGQDAADDLNKVIRDANKDAPNPEKLTQRLESISKVIKVGTKVGATALKAVPIITGLIKAASMLF